MQEFSGVWQCGGARSRLIEDNAMPQNPAQVLDVHSVGAQRQSTSNIYHKPSAPDSAAAAAAAGDVIAVLTAHPSLRQLLNTLTTWPVHDAHNNHRSTAGKQRHALAATSARPRMMTTRGRVKGTTQPPGNNFVSSATMGCTAQSCHSLVTSLPPPADMALLESQLIIPLPT